MNKNYTEDVRKKMYHPQEMLPHVGRQGQERLGNSRVLIIGLGGLGSPASLYLATSGVGTLGLCDFDVVEAENLGRQILFTPADIGKKKTTVAATKLAQHNPWITIKCIEEAASKENIEKLLSSYDLILECTDNLEAKFLVHDFCQRMKKDLVSASIYHTEGTITCFPFASMPEKDTACLRCLYRDVPDTSQWSSCTETGVLHVAAGAIALMQTSLAVKVLLQWTLPSNTMFLFDVRTWEWQSICIPKDPQCTLCSPTQASNPHLDGKTSPPHQKDTNEDDSIDMHEFPDDIEAWTIIDIRKEVEKHSHSLLPKSAQHMPDALHYDISTLTQLFSPNTKYLIICNSGFTSRIFTTQLRAAGIAHAFSFLGGFKRLTILGAQQHPTYDIHGKGVPT